MKAIHAIWKNGQIVPTQPVDWPDGTALSVEPIGEPASHEADEDLWGDDPASIARRVAAYEALPPLQMSEAEEAEWQAARQEVKDYTIAKMQSRRVEDLP
jgi:hypothetical protein